MKGETKKFIRTFLWLSYDNDGPKKVSTFQGQSLINAIMVKFQTDNCFMHWDKTHFGFEQSFKEKAITVLEKIESGGHNEKYVVMDLTDSLRPILLFPKDKRPPGFDDSVIGYEYTVLSFIKTGEEGDDQINFDSFKKAKRELEHHQTLQPENVYRIRNVTKDETILTS